MASTTAPSNPVTPVPEKNPLGPGRYIETAGAIIIGDEVLNGKIQDTNSHHFATWCFERGIELKRIEVIADDEEEIVEAARRMTEKYDFVITSGGIGPTHDDITYQSLAKAFNTPLSHDAETLRRMTEHAKARGMDVEGQDAEQREARERMALFPVGGEVLFVDEKLWVPVVRLGGKLCIFPGIPSLLKQLLAGLEPFLPLPPASAKATRHLIETALPESSIAPYLTELHRRLRPENIRVGSYPKGAGAVGVVVSLIGKNKERVLEIGQEVVEKLQGKVVTQEELDAAKAAGKD